MADYPGGYRHSDLSYMDPPYPAQAGYSSNLDPLRRSATHTSHYSHATTDTRSWVQSNQQHPPPPPLDEYEVEDLVSQERTPRPLPQQPQTYVPGGMYAVNASEPIDDEEDYMAIDPNVSGQYEYQPNTITVPNRRFFRSPPPDPQLPSTSTQPTKQRSFVGGFVRGLRRLPKRMMGYGVGPQKGRLFRRGTFGTEASGTSAGMTRGNTLPEYRSNPSTPVAGPTGVQYVQDLQMAFAPNNPIPELVRPPPPQQEQPQEPIPTSLLSGSALRRVTPSFRITPPSESVSHESHAQIFQSPQPQYAQVVHPDPSTVPNNAERTTVMVYNDTVNGEAASVHMPVAEPLPQWTPSRTPRVSATTSGRVPSVTIQTPMGHPPPPPPSAVQQPPRAPDLEQVIPGRDMVQSPATEHPPPAPDYRKMPHFPGSPSRNTMFTRSTATSWYDPSYTSDLTPVERFFKTLYNLPWVSHGRVTIDYRPGAGLEGKDKYKAMIKKPMASWYRRFSRSSKNAELDLLSNGTMSIPNMTPRTSLGTSIMSSTPASPRSNRTGRRSTTGSDGRHHKSGHSGHRRHRHRHHRHRRRSMSTIEEPNETRAASPMIPAPYPYAYPAYPFTYPGYAAMPPVLPLPPGMTSGSPSGSPAGPSNQQTIPMQVIPTPVPLQAVPQAEQRRSSKRSPRGPRSRNTRRPTVTYANGYAPYQAMAYPPPVYVAQGSPTGGTQGQVGPSGTTPPQAAPQIIQYVPMQLVPGAYNASPDFMHSMTNSIPSPPSSPTPRAASAAPPGGS